MKTSKISKIVEYIAKNKKELSKVIIEIASSIENESIQLQRLATHLKTYTTTSEALYVLNEIYRTDKGKEIIRTIYNRQKIQEHRHKKKLNNHKFIQIELDNETVKNLENESKKKKKRPSKVISEILTNHFKKERDITRLAEKQIALAEARALYERRITDSILETLEINLKITIELETKQIHSKEPLGSSYIRKKMEAIHKEILTARNKFKPGPKRPMRRPLN